MQLTGQSFIAGQRGESAGLSTHALNPATGEELAPAYFAASADELERAVRAAAEAFPIFSKLPGKQRASFLRRIAAELDTMQQEIAARAHLETALPMPRLLGEVGRTTGQLRLFAEVLEEGSWVEARIDTPLPNRTPLPRPSLRSMLRALGPVAVFGASNFPIAFSAAGGDTAAALAAGCPVVFKAHPAHPGTCELVAHAIHKAASACGIPAGVYSLLYDAGTSIGTALVQHPEIQAVAFTGSLHVGRTLMNLAAARPNPIPCFTEMSAVNPLFLLAGAIRENPQQLAQNLFQSVTLGAGQFCTRPGLVFFVHSEESSAFVHRLEELMAAASPFTLLTKGIAAQYAQGTRARSAIASSQPQAEAIAGSLQCAASARLFTASVEQFLQHADLADEIFGPTTLLVPCATQEDLLRAAAALQGQLTAGIFATPQELAQQEQLVNLLERKAGRVIFNAFPTGVEVSHAMVHGGPYPATSDARFTSVGSQAIYRFVRPVCFQGFPDELVPQELWASNPLGIERLVDGKRTREPIQ